MTEYEEHTDHTLQSENDDVSIAVNFGNGHNGKYKIYKNGEKISSNEPAEAGTAQACDGATIRVIAVIPNTVSQTKWTNVKVTVKEGRRSETYNYEHQLPESSNAALYDIEIPLKK